MKRVFAAALIAMMSLCFTAASARADQVDNPQFASWSKCNVGSSVSYEQTAAGAAVQIVVKVTKTLKDKAADHVTLDVNTTLAIANAANGPPPQASTETVPAKLDKQPDQKPLPNEQIQVGDQKIDCKVNQMDIKDPQGNDVKVKTWTSDDIPGGLVKMEANATVQNTPVTTTLQVKSFEKK